MNTWWTQSIFSPFEKFLCIRVLNLIVCISIRAPSERWSEMLGSVYHKVILTSTQLFLLIFQWPSYLLQIFPPFIGCIILCDFDLEEVIVGHESRQFCGALSTRTSNTGQQAVSIVLFEYTGHTGNMLDGELEHDELHRCLANHVVLIKVTENTMQKALTDFATKYIYLIYTN